VGRGAAARLRRIHRIHRIGIIACLYRAAGWRHKDVERAAYELLQRLDEKAA
jgi:hypothetical protein